MTCMPNHHDGIAYRDALNILNQARSVYAWVRTTPADGVYVQVTKQAVRDALRRSAEYYGTEEPVLVHADQNDPTVVYIN